jgi:hypothetical protein
MEEEDAKQSDSMVVIVAVLQMMGARDGQSAGVLTADETNNPEPPNGLGVLTFATDSTLPAGNSVCALPAGQTEATSACFPIPHRSTVEEEE